ncbi:MAG TPA: RIP metalloprotease RseP [Rhodocyclaceae bacterium]|nr:RIP metalloprotease RseP [Rhodocyclaceae bacterium]
MLWYPLAFLAALGVLVTVHELGHFIAAKLCRIKVLRFSVGFGRTLWSRRSGRDQTEWCIAAIPLGGYVKMLDEREVDVVEEERHRAFNRQSLARRSFVVSAGPIANLLLAVVIYWLMFMSGVQELKPVLGAPVDGSVAAQSGVVAGMQITKVDDLAIQTWSDFRVAVLNARLDHRPVALEVRLGEQVSSVAIATDSLSSTDLDGDLLHKLGITLYQPPLPPTIGQVQAGSPAQRGGLAVEDLVLSVGGHPVNQWSQVVEIVRASAGIPLEFEVRRKGRVEIVRVVPDKVSNGGKGYGRMGAAVRADPGNSIFMEIRYNPVQAAVQAVRQTWSTIRLSLSMMGRMLTGDVSWRNLSGPVTIADYAGQSAQMGFAAYIRFIALISISLGVLNLLPVPVLDGGHLMYYFVEFLKGSPVSERAMEIGQRIGFGVLGLLMAFALFNDFNRLFFG